MTVVSSRAAASTAAASVVRWELPLVALLSPLFLFPAPSRTLPLLLLPVIWIVIWRVGGGLLPVTPLNGSLALLAVMVFVSTFATYDLDFSLPKIAGVVLGLAMFFALARRLDSRRWVGWSLHVLGGLGAALALLGILGTNWIAKVGILQPIVAKLPVVIRGIPGQAEGFQPNAIAGALTMFVPLQIALTFGRRAPEERSGKSRLAHGLLLTLTVGTLVLTQSRTAWIATMAGLTAWTLWNSRRSRLVAVALIVVLGAIFLLGRQTLVPLVASQLGAGVRGDIAGRLELWDRALLAIGDFPFTGMGMNTFRRIVMVLYPTFLTSPDTDVAHAHNHLLQAALDLGLPGLIAYLAMWIGAALLLVRSYRITRGRDRHLVSGVAAGLVAYFLFGTTDAIALGAKLGIFLWIALAVVVSMHAVFSRDAADEAS